MLEFSNMISFQKPPPTQAAQEKAARQLASQFLEMVLKPMFKHQERSLGGSSWMGDSATSENIIRPMMMQNLATELSQKGDAFGLYPMFLKAIQKSQTTHMPEVTQ